MDAGAGNCRYAGEFSRQIQRMPARTARIAIPAAIASRPDSPLHIGRTHFLDRHARPFEFGRRGAHGGKRGVVMGKTDQAVPFKLAGKRRRHY